jgi:proline dehydrogenase
MRSLVRAAARPVFRFLSRAYVPGPELGDAIEAVHRFARSGHAATVGYFNAVGEAPRRIADFDLAAVDALAGNGRDAYVSLKVPAMKYDRALIEEIALASRRTGVGIHFDSHAIETAGPTFAAAEIALAHAPTVGCTLPGRWRRSVTDAERAIELGLRARVVKGQWADPAQPGLDPASGYLAVIDRLAGRARAVAVATHDPALAREAIRRLRDSNTPCELELLFGLPMRAASAVAREAGVRVRAYVPFGEAWMPYALSQLRRRPGTLWWMAKDALAVFVPRMPG